ncbi:MAG: hypothetical protein AAGB48_03085 [Planctomycetota bacterium]
MKTLTITSEHVRDGKYTGPDVSDYDGHIELESDLGWVRFEGDVCARGQIYAKAGSGIKAGLGIEAGLGIKAGLGIEAGLGIKAGSGIEAGLGIKAGLGIEAGSGIEAGEGIEAGSGILCGFGIACAALAVSARIVCGACHWREPEGEESEIRCTRLVSGTVVLGTLVEVGEPNQPDSEDGATRINDLERRVSALEKGCDR